MKKIALCCILILSVSAIASTEIKNIDHIAKVDNFVWYGPVFLEKLSIEQIRKLGALEKETMIEVDNPYYEDIKIPYYTFVFKEGLTINCRLVSRHASGEHVQYTSVHVASKKWPILHDFKVGKNITKVKEYFGAPDQETDQMLTYYGGSEEVRFSHKNNIITKIDFIYYAD